MVNTTTYRGWNPNTARPVIGNVPAYTPKPEQAARLALLFFNAVGGFASVVQTQITDTYNLVKEDKKLFRFGAKKALTDTKQLIDVMIADFHYHMDNMQSYQVWLDTTDIIEDDMKADLQKCYYAMDNRYLQCRVKQHRMYTLIVMSEILSGMLVDTVDAFSRVMDEVNGNMFQNIANLFKAPAKGVHTRMRQALELLYPVEVDNEVFGGRTEQFKVGFAVIGKKLLDWKRINDALSDAWRMNGLNIMKEGSEDKENFSTSGAPWSESQIRAMNLGYSDTPTKEIASILGRSVYEVNKQAKKMGLKKDPEYLKNQRIKNLQKKKTA